MSELLSALDALAADDLDDLVAPQLLDRSALLVRARNRIDAELARTVHRADCGQAPEHDGAEVDGLLAARASRLSPAAANLIVRNGRTLAHLPAVAAACADGTVTAEQVSVIAPITKPKNLAAAAEQGIDLGEVDLVLAETAATRQHVHLGLVVHHYLSRLDPDGTEPDPTEGRSLSIARHADGSRTFRGELDAVGGEKFEAMLESFVQADRPAGDRRTRAQQLADALVQAADVALASGRLPTLRTVKPHVIVDHPAGRPGRPRRSARERRAPASGRRSPPPAPACSPATATSPASSSAPKASRWTTAAPNGSSPEPAPRGRAAGLALRVRRLPRPQLLVRRPPPDHWADDGDTCLDNSALLCERHHTKVHHGFTVVRDPDGRWHTYRPDGTEILIHPLII